LEINPIILLILAGALGGLCRSILGWLGEREPDEPFSVKKCIKSILRATIGGAILGYWLGLDPKGTFFAAFAADLSSKNVWDLMKKK